LRKILNLPINKDQIFIDDPNRSIEKIESDLKKLPKGRSEKITLLKFYIKKYRDMSSPDYKIKVGLTGGFGAGITSAFNKFLGYSENKYIGKNKPLWLKMADGPDEDKNTEEKIELIFDNQQYSLDNIEKQPYHKYIKNIKETVMPLNHDYCVLYLTGSHIKSGNKKINEILTKIELIDLPGIDKYLEKCDKKKMHNLLDDIDIVFYFIKNQSTNEPVPDNFIELIRSKGIYKNELNFIFNYASNDIEPEKAVFDELKSKIANAFPDNKNYYNINSADNLASDYSSFTDLDSILMKYSTNNFEYYKNFLKRKLLNKILSFYVEIINEQSREDNYNERENFNKIINAEKSVIDEELNKYKITIDNDLNNLLHEIDGIKANHSNNYNKLSVDFPTIINDKFKELKTDILNGKSFDSTTYDKFMIDLRDELNFKIDEVLFNVNMVRQAASLKKFVSDTFDKLIDKSIDLLKWLKDNFNKLKKIFFSDKHYVSELDITKTNLINDISDKLKSDCGNYTKEILLETTSNLLDRFFYVISQSDGYTVLPKIIDTVKLGSELKELIVGEVKNCLLDQVNKCVKTNFAKHKHHVTSLTDNYFNELKKNKKIEIIVQMNNSRQTYLNQISNFIKF